MDGTLYTVTMIRAHEISWLIPARRPGMAKIHERRGGMRKKAVDEDGRGGMNTNAANNHDR